jgi:hypothetical protein
VALQPVYLVAAKNLGKFLEALRHAQAPEKVTLRFIEELGFTSTNDRLFIPLLKALRFLDDSGKPSSRYHAFLDDSEWQRVLASGVRDAFADLFRINRDAQKLSREQLAGKIKSLGEGKISPAILTNTTKTFMELVKIADFSATSEAPDTPPSTDDATDTPAIVELEPSPDREDRKSYAASTPTLVYRIEIVLPAVRDQAIYDAIFKSAKEHLLK